MNASDQELLARYAQKKSEDAFAELVTTNSALPSNVCWCTTVKSRAP